jgi:hypothetical protein
MPFAPPLPKLAVAANMIANLPRRAAGRPPLRLTPWDPEACNPFEQEAISNAFFSLGNSQIPEIRGRGADWQILADLMKTKTVSSLSITCGYCRGGNPMSSDANSKSLQVCLDTSRRDYLAAWLVVEVVKLCGGTDLDAWAVKNWLFSVNKSSYPYVYYQLLPSEKALMCAGGTRLPSPFPYLAGKFTIWDNVYGNLWPLWRDPSNNGRITPWQTSLIPGGGPRTYWQWPC